MKFGNWNVRGIGDNTKRRSVKDGILLSGVNVVGLQETKISSSSNIILKSISGTSTGL